MAANPKRYPHKMSRKDGSLNSVRLTSFTAIHSTFDRVSLEQEQAYIRDSAFLAERGLSPKWIRPKSPPAQSHSREPSIKLAKRPNHLPYESVTLFN